MTINDADMLTRLEQWEDENGADDGTNRREKVCLYGLVRHVKPESVIEVGVSAGGMTSWIAAALEVSNKGTLTSVDNWTQNDGGKASSPEPARKRLEDIGIDHRVEFVTADSHDWMPEQDADSADIVWVDGDHSYHGAMHDLSEAWRIATDLVAFHDSAHLPGPREVADEIEQGVRLTENRGLLLLEPE